jgi:hypothetical protein
MKGEKLMTYLQIKIKPREERSGATAGIRTRVVCVAGRYPDVIVQFDLDTTESRFFKNPLATLAVTHRARHPCNGGRL